MKTQEVSESRNGLRSCPFCKTVDGPNLGTESSKRKLKLTGFMVTKDLGLCHSIGELSLHSIGL